MVDYSVAADRVDRRAQVAFWLLLTVGAAFRIWLALKGHSIRYPDEIFQTIEQAHRLVFGYSIRPWEFREGVRWMGTPLLLTPPLLLARWLGLGPDFYMPLTRGLLALLSLLPFPVFFVLVRRRAGEAAAVLACLVPLFGFENLDFTGSTLSEAIVAPVLATAICLALLVDRTSRRRDMIVLGVLLCLSFCLRFHVAPAILAAATVAWVRTGRPQRLTLVATIAAMLAGLSLVDMLFGQWPFQHVWLNIVRNLVDNIADKFGTEPWWFYLAAIWEHWGWSIVPAALLVLWRWRETWLFLLGALAIVAVFSVIGHKEYRFYFPATVLFTFALGWALSSALVWIAHRVPAVGPASWPSLLAAAVIVGWSSSGSAYQKVLSETDDTRISAELAASRQPDVCGLDNAIRLSVLGTAGFAYFNHDVPFGAVTPESPQFPELSHYNYVIGAPDLRAALGADYSQLACWASPTSSSLCLYRRPGGCTSTDDSRDPPGPEAGD